MGETRITACPLSMLDEDLGEMIGLVQLFRKGLAPVAGGTLDQTRWFLSFANLVNTEIDRWKSELLILEDE